jgi:hypothetical protein
MTCYRDCFIFLLTFKEFWVRSREENRCMERHWGRKQGHSFEWIYKGENRRVGSELVWLRVWTSGGLL